jgi:hypothetical protein
MVELLLITASFHGGGGGGSGFSVVAPVREEAVEQGCEALVVGRLPQMGHFMHDDVFEAFSWLLS